MMAARSCAKRAHQLTTSTLSWGVGPSRLPTTSACACHLFTTSTPVALRNNASDHKFSTSASVYDESSSSASAAAKNAEPPSSSKTASIGLFAGEDANAEPTLEYLDSLKPRARRIQRGEQRPKRGTVNPFAKSSSNKNNAEDKQWERTRARINASFTRDQLASLGRAARLPGSYARTVKKDDLVRRIMIHRFGMEDARERAEREKREELDKRSVHISFRPAELYLLLARGSNRVRQEASKAQVVMLPQGPAKEKQQSSSGSASTETKLGFWIRGKDEGIKRMTKWVEGFKQSIKTKEETIVLFAEARNTETTSETGFSEVLPAELVRYISQLSRCFLEASPIQHGKVTLSLAYLDERDAGKAVLLLRQYHAEAAKAIHRIGAAAYSDNFSNSRKYSMLPFVPNEPTPWIKQADDLLYGSHSDFSFRVSYVPELNAFSMLSTTKFPEMKLSGWSHQGELQFVEPFRALIESATTQSAECDAVECSAELGHVLFDAGGLTLADEGLSEEEIVLRLQDPLAAPLSGSWPIQSALHWARQFHTRFGREASRFVPSTLFRSQKNTSLDVWLERQGYMLATSEQGALPSERLVLVYQPADAGYLGQRRKLEIVLVRQQNESNLAEAAKGGWQIHQTRWVSEAQADLMVPDKGADLRLVAKTSVALEAEELAAVESGLASCLSPRPQSAAAKAAVEEVESGGAAGEAEVDEMEHVRTDVDAVLGDETEVVERSSTSAPEAESMSTSNLSANAGVIRPSTLDLGSAGKVALESVMRSTVQTYVQRSALPVASPSPEPDTVSEPPTAIDDSATTPAVDVVEQRPASPETGAVSTTPFATTKQEGVSAQVAPVSDASTQPTATSESVASAFSPILIREISQDSITRLTSQSLRITWRLRASSEPSAPEWTSVVEPISALLEQHDLFTR